MARASLISTGECNRTVHPLEVAIAEERTVMSVAVSGAQPRNMDANGRSATARKVELGQFMTPTTIAQFMASLFSEPQGPVRLLDAGAVKGL